MKMWGASASEPPAATLLEALSGKLNYFTSPRWEEIGARVSIRTCTLACKSDCSVLVGIARAIKLLCILNTEFLFSEARQNLI